MRFSTRSIHSGHDPSDWAGASLMPITASAAYSSEDPEGLEAIFAGRSAGHVYGRLSNPCTTTLERRWAALEEGARGAAVFSSGMAAISATFSALAEAGEQVICSVSLFGGTRAYLDNILSRNGVRVHYVNHDQIRQAQDLKRLINAETRCLFLEILGNPRMDVPDIHIWAQAAQECGIPLVLDTTLVTQALFQASQYGVSLTVQSGTKFLTGNGSVLSGVVIDTGNYKWKDFPGKAVKAMTKKTGSDLAMLVYLRKIARQNMGASLSPFDAYIALLGADTLDLRMTRHSENVLALAQYLEGRGDLPAVSQIGLPSSPWNQRAGEYFGGRWGGLLTFRAGSRERAFEILKNLKIARVQTNLGDARTLVLHLESTIHREQSPQVRAEAGVSDDLIRVSVGLEDIHDLIEDFEQAIDRAVKENL